MAVTSDIFQSYLRPVEVFRRLLDRGVNDRLGLIFLALAMGLSFVSHLPAIRRKSLEPNPELEASIIAEAGAVRQIDGVQVPQDMVDAKFENFLSGEIMVWFFVLPLIFYGLAQLGGLVVRLVQGHKLPGPVIRVAFFWALVVALPMKLLHSLVYAVTDTGPVYVWAGLPWVAVLVWNWSSNLRAAGWSR